MPIIHEVEDFNKVLHSLERPPVYINDLVNLTTEDRERVQEEIMVTYHDDDTVSLIPSCSCGKTKSTALVGHVCPYCGTEVKSNVDRAVKPIFWLRAPEGIKALPNPDIWVKISRYFTKSGFNCINYCCGIKPNKSEKVPKFYMKLESLNLPKGYNEFIDRFDETMQLLFSVSEINDKKKIADMVNFIRQNRHLVFCEAIPLPNRILVVFEKNPMGNFADFKMISGLGAMLSLVGIDNLTHIKNKEKRIVNAINELTNFYDAFYREKYQPKEGMYRKHVYASRCNFTFRSVITSITEPHERDVLLAPWSHSVTVYRHHLINKLLRDGMSHNAAVGYLNEHTDVYSEKLHKFLLEIKEESGNKLTALTQRN